MNAIYPEYLAALSRAEVDATAVDWWLLPLDPDAVFDPTDTVLADVSGDAVGAGLQIAFDGLQVVTSIRALRYLTSGTNVFTDIPSGQPVDSLVAYADDGVGTWLAAWLDTRSDTSPVELTGTGDDVQVSFPGGWFIQL